MDKGGFFPSRNKILIMPLTSSNRVRMTPHQLLFMVQFIERYPEMATGPKDAATRKRVKVLWRILAKRLNSFDDSAKKTRTQWIKTWADKKQMIKNALKKKQLLEEWPPVDLRILRMLKQCGDVKEKIKQDKDEMQSDSSLLNNGQEANGMYCEYLDPTDETESGMNYAKNLNSTRNESEPDLRSEFSRVASVEEKRLKIEEESAQAREDTAAALDQCALAMEAMAEAVVNQATAISNAIRIQGETIAEALKAQGEMIAKALANR